MPDKILFVDDEPAILKLHQRMLAGDFEVDTAPGGEAGLKALDERGPFAVVVSDMRMPGMDGVQFLMKAHERAPNTVRIMLTVNADLTTVADAINKDASSGSW
jgi:DNA-binding NtrC family response regulator